MGFRGQHIDRSEPFRKRLGIVLVASAMLAACTPRVVIEAPNEPIVINMNVKIEHEIRVKVDKELDDLFEGNEDLF